MLYSSLEAYIKGERERMEDLQASNIPFDTSLRIEQLLSSTKNRGSDDYSRTESTPKLTVDHYGIMHDRHREVSGFRTVVRETGKEGIYAKGSDIRQERHILAGTTEMIRRISERMGDEELLDAQDLGLNMIFARDDGKYVLLEGLPIGTNFMVYPEGTEDVSDKSKLIANLRLVTQQKGCGITGKSIAERHGKPDLGRQFIEDAEYERGSVLVVDGPVGNHLLEVNQRVFIGLPTGRVR